MEQSYSISGMSCDGCRSKVEKKLNTINGIQANVVLEPPIATITMAKHIPVSTLQAA
jgi:P-type Cu+ transporter